MLRRASGLRWLAYAVKARRPMGCLGHLISMSSFGGQVLQINARQTMAMTKKRGNSRLYLEKDSKTNRQNGHLPPSY
ncbi:hypothetical protein F5X98DRAFT_52369 [Xylaria grammica]|nr:hypothetical protein F5X98DRAFT_52369 [Xylaria grammica]